MLTIAVVDDEREHIERFKQLVARFFTEFSRYGTEYNIIEFSSGEQLLENYAPRYDVIFLEEYCNYLRYAYGTIRRRGLFCCRS